MIEGVPTWLSSWVADVLLGLMFVLYRLLGGVTVGLGVLYGLIRRFVDVVVRRLAVVWRGNSARISVPKPSQAHMRRER